MPHLYCMYCCFFFFFFKQKTAYEIPKRDWSSDVCSSDLDNPIHIAIAAWSWGAYLGDEGIKNGIRAKVSSYTRHHVNVMMTKSKVSGNYINSVLAKSEVKNAGYDEAIMLDPEGYVAEAS